MRVSITGGFSLPEATILLRGSTLYVYARVGISDMGTTTGRLLLQLEHASSARAVGSAARDALSQYQYGLSLEEAQAIEGQLPAEAGKKTFRAFFKRCADIVIGQEDSGSYNVIAMGAVAGPDDLLSQMSVASKSAPEVLGAAILKLLPVSKWLNDPTAVDDYVYPKAKRRRRA